MTKLQLGVLLSAIAMFFILYFGCETKPKEQQAVEKSRALIAEEASIEVLLKDAKAALGPVQTGEVQLLEQQLEAAVDDSLRAERLKELSGAWYNFNEPAIAGYYAEQVAELENGEESWSIAGTTYTICLQRAENDRIKNYCTGRAVKCYENAISLNPANTAHKVNLALVYTENPPRENPMQGIQMLLGLNQEEPDNVLVLNSLARLAIKTGQFDRALVRLEKAASIEANNRTTICLLAQVYEGLGKAEAAGRYADQCRQLMEQRQ